MKHTEKLGSFENFQWEVFSESETIDYARVKKYVYNLLLDKAKAQDARDESEEKIAEANTRADEAVKAQKAAEKKVTDADSTGQIAELTEKAATEAARADVAEGKLLRLEVGDEKGLTAKQALRLQGATKEELEADADAVIEEFGLAKPASENDDDDDEDDDDEEGGLRRQPTRLTTPLDRREDPDKGGPATEAEFEKAIAERMGGRIFA
jgi:hypothetical protein